VTIIRAQIITWRNENGLLDLSLSFPVNSTGDVVGESPPGQPVVVESLMGDVVLQQIIDSSNYGPGAVVWDEPNPYPPGGTPGAQEWALMRAFLNRWMTPQEISEAIGLTPHGRSRLEIGNELITWLKDRQS